MDKGICRCGAEILWAKTPIGKATPLDRDPHPEGNVQLTDGVARVLSKEDAELLRSFDPDEPTPLYRSHFATCPGAGAHRKPAKAASVQGVTSDPTETLRQAGFRPIRMRKAGGDPDWERGGRLYSEATALALPPLKEPPVFCPSCHYALDGLRKCWRCRVAVCDCGRQTGSVLVGVCRICEVEECRVNGTPY